MSQPDPTAFPPRSAHSADSPDSAHMADLRVTAPEAIDLVIAHCAAEDLDYPADNLVALLIAGECWEVGMWSDPYDLDTLRIGAAVFLVTPNKAIHRGSSSLPPHARWRHVPASDMFAPRPIALGQPICGKKKYDWLSRAAALLQVAEDVVHQRPLPDLDATYYWTDGDADGGSAAILARANPTYLLTRTTANPDAHARDFRDGHRTY